jgi:hypothetical protein
MEKDAYSIKECVEEYDFPVSFGFSCGHIEIICNI